MTKVEIWEEARNETAFFVWLAGTLHHGAPSTLGWCMSKWKPRKTKGFLETTSKKSSELQTRQVKMSFETYLCSGHLAHYTPHPLSLYPQLQNVHCRNWDSFLPCLFMNKMKTDLRLQYCCNYNYTIRLFCLSWDNFAGSPLSTGGKYRRESSPSAVHLYPKFSVLLTRPRSPVVTAS